MLTNLNVILVKTRFPENIGMAARACANMGCGELALVNPELYLREKAAPLATAQGEPILDKLAVYPSLTAALAERHAAWGATARTGGWRKSLLSPWQGAARIVAALGRGDRVSLVLGPEDRGLTNGEISLLNGLIHIPAVKGAASLNLAQACLILLYECRKQALGATGSKNAPAAVSLGEMTLLEKRLKTLLARLDCLTGDNADYAFLRWHNMLARLHLRRHEFTALMGLVRQMENMCLPKSGDG